MKNLLICSSVILSFVLVAPIALSQECENAIPKKNEVGKELGSLSSNALNAVYRAEINKVCRENDFLKAKYNKYILNMCDGFIKSRIREAADDDVKLSELQSDLEEPASTCSGDIKNLFAKSIDSCMSKWSYSSYQRQALEVLSDKDSKLNDSVRLRGLKTQYDFNFGHLGIANYKELHALNFSAKDFALAVALTRHISNIDESIHDSFHDINGINKINSSKQSSVFEQGVYRIVYFLSILEKEGIPFNEDDGRFLSSLDYLSVSVIDSDDMKLLRKSKMPAFGSSDKDIEAYQKHGQLESFPHMIKLRKNGIAAKTYSKYKSAGLQDIDKMIELKKNGIEPSSYSPNIPWAYYKAKGVFSN